MSKKDPVCIHCGEEFKPNPRIKNQQYCSKDKCQKARKTAWQREKMATDPDYQENQINARKQWQERDCGHYYRDYRQKHPEYVERNRLLQRVRDARRRKNKGKDEILAKMDALIRPYYSLKGSIFRLIPQDRGIFTSRGNLAKMDSLLVKLIPVKAFVRRD